MIKIGITGGIGSGKSVVCDILRLYDIPVFNADTEAKKLNDSSPTIREQLIRHFGRDLYKDNKLDRKKLAEIIFHNQQNLNTVNSIIHPELAKRFADWINQRSHYTYTVIDAALLFEANFHIFVDKTITVYAPVELRIKRTVSRDNVRKEDVEARMSKQWPEEDKIKMADFVIYNDNKHSLLRQTAGFFHFA